MLRINHKDNCDPEDYIMVPLDHFWELIYSESPNNIISMWKITAEEFPETVSNKKITKEQMEFMLYIDSSSAIKLNKKEIKDRKKTNIIKFLRDKKYIRVKIEGEWLVCTRTKMGERTVSRYLSKPSF